MTQNEDTMSYNYFSLPNPMLDKAIVSNKTFLKDMRSYVGSMRIKDILVLENITIG